MVLVAGGWQVISRWCGQWVGGTYRLVHTYYIGVVSKGGNAVLLVFRDIVAIDLQQHVGGKWSLLRHIHDHSMT